MKKPKRHNPLTSMTGFPKITIAYPPSSFMIVMVARSRPLPSTPSTTRIWKSSKKISLVPKPSQLVWSLQTRSSRSQSKSRRNQPMENHQRNFSPMKKDFAEQTIRFQVERCNLKTATLVIAQKIAMKLMNAWASPFNTRPTSATHIPTQDQ